MIYFIFTPLAGHFWELTFQPSPHILPIVFRKMTFTIHLIFTSLAGIILRRFLTTFCSCFMFCLSSFSKRSLFFVLIPWYCIWCFMNFFVGIFFSRIHCNFVFITFPKADNGLPHSIYDMVLDVLWTSRNHLWYVPQLRVHVTAQDVSSVFSELKIVCHILCLL